MTEPDADRPTTKRPTVYADDLTRITDLMAHKGVTGDTAEVLHALVKEFEAQASRATQRETQAIAEVAQTINWFTSEIETLRRQYRSLEQTHQQLPAQRTASEEVTALKQRNAQLVARNTELEADLQETRSQLDAIQELLGGLHTTTRSNGEMASTSSVASSVSPSTSSPADQPVADQPTPRTAPKAASRPSKSRPESLRQNTDSTDKIADVIDAIIKWNTAQERSEQRLRISFPSIRSLAVLVGASYLPAIKAVMTEKDTEINEIHERYLIGSRHNRSVPDKDAVLQAIARDYLGIPNWQEATYVN